MFDAAVRREARSTAIAIPIIAVAAAIALSTTGPRLRTTPSVSTVPETTTAARNTAYSGTRNASRVRAAARELSPARRSAHSVSPAPPAPAVGSRRVAAAPASVICALSRVPMRGVARPATSDNNPT